MSEFGVNPAEKAVKAYLQTADMYQQEATIRLSEEQMYSPYRYTGRGYSMMIYTGTSTDQIAGVQITIGEEQLRSFPMAERNAFINRCLTSAFAAVQGDAGTEPALAVIQRLFDTTRLTPSAESVYDGGILYGCFVDGGEISFVAMPVSETAYTAQSYWWVNQSTSYLIAQGDTALRAQEYDDAIWYYEEAGLTTESSEDLSRAYYEKAAGYLAAGKYDQAIALFDKIPSFSDSAARRAESFYKKGDEQYNAGELVGAMNSFANAGNYEDANQRFLSCSYWLGEEALAAKNYDGAELYFEQAIGYLDADVKIKQVNYERAEQLAEAGDEAGAAIYYEQAAGYMDAEDKAGAEFYTKGEAALANEDYEAAIAFFTQAGNYKDSKERLQEIADIGDQQAYEDAISLYDRYFQTFKSADYDNAVSALGAVQGTQDAMLRLAKIQEFERIWSDITDASMDWQRFNMVGLNTLAETSGVLDTITMEIEGSTPNSWIVITLPVDGSSFAIEIENVTYKNETDTILAICGAITGNFDRGGLLSQIATSDWKEAGDGSLSMTVFGDGYKVHLQKVYLDSSHYASHVVITATQNAY